jgi:hypothetical protein
MANDVAANVPLPFDLPVLIGHLNTTDPLALVIRAHLYVEAILIRHIETVVVNREQFDSARLPFRTKIELAVAIGRVDPADVGALNVLNSLRNKFAHKLDTLLQEQDESKLHNALSERQRRFVNASRTLPLDYMGRLRCDLVGIIIATNEDTVASH